MSEHNRHGLPRSIPEPRKRLVRQRCGFGCVVCGSAVIQYHHFSPAFSEAKDHDPEGITLLCGTHHQEVGNWLSDQDVIKHNAAPYCQSKDAHRLVRVQAPLYVIAGTAIFFGTGDLITVGSEPALKIVVEEGRLLLNATFFDDAGRPTIKIVDNELSICRDTWDAQFVGKQAIVRESAGRISLRFSVIAPNCIYFEHLDFAFGTSRVVFRPDRFELWNRNGLAVGNSNFVLCSGGGIFIDESGPKLRNLRFLTYSSDRFVELAKTGQVQLLLSELGMH
ncbi:hypothetical protein DFR29_103293 [Tahibacter aquaticus]|uniref:HNH endonuclease n=1 Tax=Tahibacter aquaticus TaxID=520092 RepID=A0A4R6Z4Y6_9GAMM|nr:hypothetical protein [Tahibacter aquaticus]TDR46757.1 hypothetical protein DFR29_103293 [Tahibacter aquaticus]